MHDLRWIRENPDAFDSGLKRRGLETLAGEVLELDSQRRAAQTELQDIQTRRNEASKKIGIAKQAGEDADDIIAEVAALKDRIGSEVKTHYPDHIEEGIQITLQESWIRREETNPITVPDFITEVVEGIAFEGRQDQRVDKRSGVSQRLPIACLESTVSNAERRALTAQEKEVVPRISDIYAAIPAISGKLELEYEGELKGAENVIRDLIRSSLLRAFKHHFQDQKFDQIVQWFDLGGVVQVHDQTPAAEYFRKVKVIQGLEKTLKSLGVSTKKNLPGAISWVEFILEGLYAQKLLSRNEERGYFKEVEAEPEERLRDFPVPEKSFN